MGLAFRRVLYSTFIIAFLILAPVLTLYTAGYRINLKGFRLEKTGVLSVQSVPRNATVYLDDVADGTTPRRFSALLPGEYQLRVEAPDFYTWEKTVTVKSNLTTFNHDIVLFKKSAPVKIIEGNIQVASPAPGRDKLAYIRRVDKTDELRLLNLKTQADFLITTFQAQSYTSIEFTSWSPDQRSVLIRQRFGESNSYSVLDTDTLKLRALSDITTLNFDTLAWDASNQYYFYGLRDNQLYRVDTVTNSVRQLPLGIITDIRARGSQLLYITASGTERFLNRASASSQGPDTVRQIKLQNNSAFELQPSPAEIIALRDKLSGDIFVIGERAFDDAQAINEQVLLHDNAARVYSSDTANRLIYVTNFELWAYDIGANQKSLITRYGEPIGQAAWYDPYKYIFYQLGETVHAIEVTEDKIKIDVPLVTMTDLSQFISGSSGDTLYLIGNYENQQGIFSLEIQ